MIISISNDNKSFRKLLSAIRHGLILKLARLEVGLIGPFKLLNGKPKTYMGTNSGVTRGGRGGRVAHPWKVWGKFWKEGGKEKKGRERKKRRNGKREVRKKGKVKRKGREIKM